LHNALHLLDQPVEWLSRLANLLEQGGQLIASVANTNELIARVGDWQAGTSHTLQTVSPRRLRQWCRASGLNPLNVVAMLDGNRRPARKAAAKMLGSLFGTRFILTATRP
jgi:hypothetical protein